jgi:hypothetical protein
MGMNPYSSEWAGNQANATEKTPESRPGSPAWSEADKFTPCATGFASPERAQGVERTGAQTIEEQVRKF